MRTAIPQQLPFPSKPLCVRPGLAAASALLAVPMFLAAQAPGAITPSRPVAAPTLHKTAPAVHGRKRAAAAHAVKAAAEAPVTPQTPATPPAPVWPMNEKANEASITWDSHGLRIMASNSSLKQILSDVTTATGTTIDGLNTDQRIFGSYGPGEPREVLSQLLRGSGYNVLMIGDQGQGVPRHVVLSTARVTDAAGAHSQQAAGGEEDSDTADDQQQPQPPQQMPPNLNNGYNPGAAPRTPQQIMQEMQQRQQMQQRANPQ